MRYNVFEYLNLNSKDKLEFFMETRSSLSFLASYWFNFENVQKNLELYDSPDLYTLDYLIGKSDKEMDEFFRKRPGLNLLFPYLLGIRKNKFEKPFSKRILKIQDVGGVYYLDFNTIDTSKLDIFEQTYEKVG